MKKKLRKIRLIFDTEIDLESQNFAILKRPKGQKYFYGCFQSSLALCTKPYYSPLNSGAYRKITSGTLNQKSWHKCKPFLCNSCAITYSFVFRISPPPIKYLREINFL